MNLVLLTNALWLLIAGLLLLVVLRCRRRIRELKGRGPVYPIPAVRLQDFHPAFAASDRGPTLDAETHFLGTGDGVPSGTTDREAWILSVLAKGSRRMFEFGTSWGRTAYLWARNSGDDARVFTLTLAPGMRDRYSADSGDSKQAGSTAINESIHEQFIYSGTPQERKITQLFADSKSFDDAPYADSCDLVFVDGSHAYSYVKSDSEKALRMVAPGGVVVWHDYRGKHRKTQDVFDYLNVLAKSIPLVRFAESSLVAYRRPTAGNADPRP